MLGFRREKYIIRHLTKHSTSKLSDKRLHSKVTDSTILVKTHAN